jgi:hypothetical protein
MKSVILNAVNENTRFPEASNNYCEKFCKKSINCFSKVQNICNTGDTESGHDTILLGKLLPMFRRIMVPTSPALGLLPSPQTADILLEGFQASPVRPSEKNN